MMTRPACAALLLFAFSLSAEEPNQAEFFEAKIRPVLIANCYECHSSSAKKVGGELLLDFSDRLRKGGESGSPINFDSPDASLLLEALRYEGLEMPPSGKLPDRVIADFEQWIKTGAYDPRDESTAQPRDPRTIDLSKGRQFWSFQRPQAHAPPQVQNPDWPQRKIDQFVLGRMEAAHLIPTQAADRRTMIRRVTFDLVGLPPTPDEVAAFLNDESPNAYQHLVERLLASPQFGGRWARLWLDVSRYAEDQAHIVGNNGELFYPNAYRYRNWLIHSFNDDMPFDESIRFQLAADLVAPDDLDQLPALGFLGLGPKYYRRNAPEVMADEWEDRVDTVSRGLLGITVACARCHDHKYDPIPTEDYYALAGVFASTEMYNKPPEGWKPTEKQKQPDPSTTLHILREGTPQDLKVHIRGDALNEGKLVPRHLVSVLQDEPVSLRSGSGRADLADAITSRENPLTARVIVNRIWGEYFGRPLVGTPSNFGQLGLRPTHPQLLDDLAVRFMDAGWSLKWLHREIVMSATYQQSSQTSHESLAADPENVLLTRMNRRRVSVEMWRDTLLATTGQLDLQVGGESIDVQDPTTRRRSVYTKVSRLELDSMLKMFDYPDPNVHAAKRSRTTTPLQKLFVLNSPFMVRRAEQLAERIIQADPHDLDRVHRAYELLFCREPSNAEVSLASEFLESGEPTDRWTQYAQILLASNELLFLD